MKFHQRESMILELKRELPRNDQIIKTVIGFCNQGGGQLIIGIANDGTVNAFYPEYLLIVPAKIMILLR